MLTLLRASSACLSAFSITALVFAVLAASRLRFKSSSAERSWPSFSVRNLLCSRTAFDGQPSLPTSLREHPPALPCCSCGPHLVTLIVSATMPTAHCLELYVASHVICFDLSILTLPALWDDFSFTKVVNSPFA